jgi:hypothetical protein
MKALIAVLWMALSAMVQSGQLYGMDMRVRPANPSSMTL